MKLTVIDNINTVIQFDKYIRDVNLKHIFRGHSCVCYELIPEIGRGSVQKVINENRCLAEFREDIKKNGYYQQSLEHNDFRISVLAQHYQQFPTRFLDWTSNILVALYFACCNLKKHDQDGAVWLFPAPDNNDEIWVNQFEEKIKSPFEFNKVKLFICSSFIDDCRMKLGEVEFGNQRDDVQRSVMTLHPKSQNGEFDNLKGLISQYKIQKVIIPKESKMEILKSLSEEPYWINENTLFKGKSMQEEKSEKKWEEIQARMLNKEFKIQHSQ